MIKTPSLGKNTQSTVGDFSPIICTEQSNSLESFEKDDYQWNSFKFFCSDLNEGGYDYEDWVDRVYSKEVVTNTDNKKKYYYIEVEDLEDIKKKQIEKEIESAIIKKMKNKGQSKKTNGGK
jgi:hypothetical protein